VYTAEEWPLESVLLSMFVIGECPPVEGYTVKRCDVTERMLSAATSHAKDTESYMDGLFEQGLLDSQEGVLLAIAVWCAAHDDFTILPGGFFVGATSWDKIYDKAFCRYLSSFLGLN
jgi:hypothetical protein